MEEQFYLLLPLLFLALAGRRRALPATLAALALLSLAGCLWMAGRDPDAAFYLLPFRAWQLLLGTLLAVAPLPSLALAPLREAAAAGLALVLLSISWLDAATTPAVGWLLPCLGTGLLLHAGRDGATLVGRLLAARPAVVLGGLSYALYLWHWPLLSLARGRGWLEPGRALDVALYLALVLLLATLSRHCLEEPIRRRRWLPGRRALWAALLASGAALFAAATLLAGGRGDPASPYAFYREGRCFLQIEQGPADWDGAACRAPAGHAVALALWGDSFAAHLYPGLRDEGIGLLQLTAAGCPPLVGLTLPQRPNCAAFNDFAWAEIAGEAPSLVVLASGWRLPPAQLEPLLRQQIRQLVGLGKRVLVIGPTPYLELPAPRLSEAQERRSEADDWVAAADTTAVEALLRRLTGEEGAALYLPSQLFCRDAGTCRLRDAEGLFFIDRAHFTRHGSTHLAQALAPLLRQLAAEP